MHHGIITLPPIVVFFMVLPWLTEGGRISLCPAMPVWGILSIIVYPEWKAIYRTAQARIAQSEDDPGKQETTG